VVEIRDKYGNPVLVKKNKITKKGVEIFAKKLVDGSSGNRESQL
jgi:hypothetical protein